MTAFVGGLLWFAIACGILVRVGRTNELLEQLLARCVGSSTSQPPLHATLTQLRPPFSNAKMAARLTALILTVALMALLLYINTKK